MTTIEGWIKGDVSLETIADAHDRYNERVAMHKDVESRLVGKNQWVGDLGEICFDTWLNRIGFSHVWDGLGLYEPDIRIGKDTIDVKTSIRNAYPRRGWTVGFPAWQKEKAVLPTYYFFMVYQPPTTIFFMGGITQPKFDKQCTFDLKGSQPHLKFVVLEDMYNIVANELTKPGDWKNEQIERS